jgi:hypothetical protein
MADAGAGAACVNEPPIGIVIGEQQGPEKGPRAFRIGPADHEGKSNLSNSAAFTNPARCRADSIMD